jgi:hypothetical protein
LISRFATTPPETVVVNNALKPERCPDGEALGPMRSDAAVKIQKCRSRIDKKYAPKWAKVERMRSGGDAAKADVLAEKLEAKVKADLDKRCAQLEASASAAFVAVFEELRTQIPQQKPTDPTARIEALRTYPAATATSEGK